MQVVVWDCVAERCRTSEDGDVWSGQGGWEIRCEAPGYTQKTHTAAYSPFTDEQRLEVVPAPALAACCSTRSGKSTPTG